MKLTLTTDDGTVLNVWEDFQEWNLDKAMAAAVLCAELRHEVEVATPIEEREKEEAENH